MEMWNGPFEWSRISSAEPISRHTVPQEGQKRPALNSTNDLTGEEPVVLQCVSWRGHVPERRSAWDRGSVRLDRGSA